MKLQAKTTQRRQSKPQQERKKSTSGEEALESTALLASTSTAVTDVPYADGDEENGTLADQAYKH